MRRADRLFQITQILRNKRLVTAKQLAERLQVSERTIYRDIQDLSLSGVPVESEPGLGYMLRHSLDIPPIMFNRNELEAILLGVKMIKAWAGQELAMSAETALDKIEAVLPKELLNHLETSKLFVPAFVINPQHKHNFETLRQAINQKQVIEINYQSLEQQISKRKLNPLGLYYWGKVWTLVAWCLLRKDFRVFRVDQIQHILVLEQTYTEYPGQALTDYIEQQTKHCEAQISLDPNMDYC
ncbi:helix-turn-helix transcriptional regulator [Aliikangiella maris]|uniref:YafY family protein n=2 Tax=Aliikangiella maris TaxID=3162458 RepID=A0ABV3MUE7_9GAMM